VIACIIVRKTQVECETQKQHGQARLSFGLHSIVWSRSTKLNGSSGKVKVKMNGCIKARNRLVESQKAA
jgi:hypothetical protein